MMKLKDTNIRNITEQMPIVIPEVHQRARNRKSDFTTTPRPSLNASTFNKANYCYPFLAFTFTTYVRYRTHTLTHTHTYIPSCIPPNNLLERKQPLPWCAPVPHLFVSPGRAEQGTAGLREGTYGLGFHNIVTRIRTLSRVISEVWKFG